MEATVDEKVFFEGWLTSSSRSELLQTALQTEPHERQEGDLFSDRYGSISLRPGGDYVCFSDSFLFSSLSPGRMRFGGLEEGQLLRVCGNGLLEVKKKKKGPPSFALEAWLRAKLSGLNHNPQGRGPKVRAHKLHRGSRPASSAASRRLQGWKKAPPPI